ncbi:tripartite tricarboxylate transporter TctB family protein [Acuticoccus sp.]|uniref:tripartite tricarboxylate transporter TctB family protein n=1 Tax=Acuticoccus sp. TaxID=1904378 RepID=UPI003B527D87
MSVLPRLLVPLALVILAALYLREADTIRPLYDSGPVGPDSVPKLYVGALLLGLVFVVITELRAARSTDGPRVSWADAGVVAAVVAISALYVVLFEPLGFVASTFAYAGSLLMAVSRGRMSILRALGQAAAITAAIYVMFSLVFEVRLPPTPFFDFLFSSGDP